MGRGNKNDRTPDRAEQQGLWKLMLRLPAVRGRLQILIVNNAALGSLCEAYQEASSMLEKLRGSMLASDPGMIREYETICSEIETEVIQYCLQHHSRVPE
ncbi:hypothetical protein [Rhizobium leguminosarum]|uniref:Nodulation protein n=1 Tax=Rhizobium leguminosarum TaxID=384 RepID=A0A2Z4YA94_RHILE|nr:hypothetical protein [Rhizobium leguminosarum]AXA37859.1 hypothetical protein DLJ82_0239 [Rhizobium leguminosarum]